MAIKKRNNIKKEKIQEPRINEELKGYGTMRLIYKEVAGENNENDFVKIVTYNEALNYSKQYGLDLIEINGSTTPPIVKLQDYSKYLYELKKAQKQKKKNNISCKEINLKVNISDHDLEIKANKAKEFIKNGDKVKVILTIRGRELGRREQSKECFYKFLEMMSDVANIENLGKDEGNKVISFLKKK